ncbi:hypothetical protein SB48_HM08orf06273 [Heyndrickxia coagulans]|uniref:Uncharacterized protein n=1 Tax=Heyndrickxia coagulans TaxID=1398 RepID=A0AAN0T6Q7_HEYCO|nr:hypothetical protein SB48_HM08orf00093 [Heyndrickxia coagulans]AJO21249.1 hypothetical protein SB48_HM08orf00708 [Heyndrickxia coagulans]AJO21256.1 hypothetical protein SB48_HM08orf00715 [Heyndrickxia coagulans]AJO21276.1 hypothetical protein SB48_HM08orf00742 [Heyndrickxia coagulans]AJO21282.1 hypothetical protein SB48_HM08orf00750 [Heyndrickxia coagulans]
MFYDKMTYPHLENFSIYFFCFQSQKEPNLQISFLKLWITSKKPFFTSHPLL